MSTRVPSWIMALGLALLFAFGLYELLASRMDEGDAYPPYSSFRADPLGTKALYAALKDLPGQPVGVERNFRSLERLTREPDGRVNDLRQTLLLLLGEEPRMWSWNPPKARVEAIEQAARAGATVFIAFRAVESVPTLPSLEKSSPAKDDKPSEPPARTDRRARQDPPEPKSTPAGEEDDNGGKTKKGLIDELKKNFLRRDVNLADRWGLDIRREKAKGKETGPGKAPPPERLDSPAFPAFPAETGKDYLPWHSAIDFEIAPTEQPLWRVMYSRSRRPVLAVRDFGAGKLIVASDAFFVSNEALFKEPNPAALAWLLADARRVVFDEQMHGTRENPGLMTFVHRYRLTGVVFALLVLALLYVWKNAAPLVPPPPDPGAEGAPPQDGLAAEAGLPSLLRRAVGPAQLPRLCFDQWKSAAGGLDGRARPTPERAAQLEKIPPRPARKKILPPPIAPCARLCDPPRRSKSPNLIPCPNNSNTSNTSSPRPARRWAKSSSARQDVDRQGAHRDLHRPPRAHRRRARRGQDAARAHARARARLRLQPHPVHARPHAGRHHRHERLQPAAQRIHAHQGPGLHHVPARRRNQPRARQDAVRAAAGDAGAPGDHRPRHARAAAEFHRLRHAEPDRIRRHLSAARGAERPLHAQDHDGRARPRRANSSSPSACSAELARGQRSPPARCSR